MCCRFPWNLQLPEPLLFLWKVALWRKVSKKPAFLQVLLWTSDDHVLAHWEFQGLLYCSLSLPGYIPGERIMILKTCVWCWWAVCWSCLAPSKDHDIVFAGLVEVSGAGASPPTLNCRWVRWWAEVLWVTQEDPCYLQLPDRSYKLHGILQQRLQLPPGTWQTSRTLWQVKLVRVANCSSSSPGTYKLFQLHQRSL